MDIGRVPFRLENYRLEEKKAEVVKFNVDLVWDGQCDIDLKAKALKVGVEKVQMRGRVSVILCPLLDRMPIVSAAQVSFVNPPFLELDFTGLADVADVKVIDKTVRKIIHGVVANMLVLPNRFLIQVDPANNFLDTYIPHLGFARITVVEGKGYKKQKKVFLRDVPDVYCVVQLGAHPEWKTSTIKNDISPKWNESKDFLLSDRDQTVALRVLDKDKIDDDDLGYAQTTVRALLDSAGTATLHLSLQGTHTGSSVTLRCHLYRLTRDLSSFSLHTDTHLACGLLVILVGRAFHLPCAEEDAKSSVQVTFGSTSFCTPVVACPAPDALNPRFNCAFHKPLQMEDTQGNRDLTFTLMNGKTTVGTFGFALHTVLDSEGKEIREKRPIGGHGASIEFSVLVRGTVLEQE